MAKCLIKEAQGDCHGCSFPSCDPKAANERLEGLGGFAGFTQLLADFGPAGDAWWAEVEHDIDDHFRRTTMSEKQWRKFVRLDK